MPGGSDRCVQRRQSSFASPTLFAATSQRPLATAPAYRVSLARDDRARARGTAHSNARSTSRFARRGATPHTVTVALELPAGLTADSAHRDGRARAGRDADGDVPRGGRLVGGDASREARLHRRRTDLHARATSRSSTSTSRRSGCIARRRGDSRARCLRCRRNERGLRAGVGDNVAPRAGRARHSGDERSRRRTIPSVGSVAVHARSSSGRARIRQAESSSTTPDICSTTRSNGGNLVVQYGQYEMARPGIMPYPMSLARPATA